MIAFDHDDAYRLAARLRSISYAVRVNHAVEVQAVARQLAAVGDAMAAQGIVLDVNEAAFR